MDEKGFELLFHSKTLLTITPHWLWVWLYRYLWTEDALIKRHLPGYEKRFNREQNVSCLGGASPCRHEWTSGNCAVSVHHNSQLMQTHGRISSSLSHSPVACRGLEGCKVKPWIMQRHSRNPPLLLITLGSWEAWINLLQLTSSLGIIQYAHSPISMHDALKRTQNMSLLQRGYNLNGVASSTTRGLCQKKPDFTLNRFQNCLHKWTGKRS